MIKRRMFVRNLFRTAGMLGMAVSLGFPVAYAAQNVRVAHSSNPGQSVYIFWDEFAKIVNADDKSGVVVRVYPSGQLGGDEQIQRGLKSGTVHMGSVSSSNMSIVTDAYLWADLPYVFRSREDAHAKFANSVVSKYLEEKLQTEAATKFIGNIDVGGFRLMINTEREIKTPDDMAGVKIRMTSSAIDQALITAWHGTPTPMPWSETFVSMEQGVINGAQLQPQAIAGFGFDKIVKYATHTQALMSFHVAQMNLKVWNRFSQTQQDLIMSAAKQALAIANKADEKDEQAFIEKTKQSVTYYNPTDEELMAWRKPALKIWDQFDSRIDPEIQKIIKP